MGSKPKSSNGVTDKQEKFIQELLKGKSQREAYKTAYPTSLKWKESAVDTQASILLSNSRVLERYTKLHERLIKEAEDDCIITAKQVLQELTNIAMANGSDYSQVVQAGNEVEISFTPTDKLDASKRSAIASIKSTQSGIEVKQHDKVKALELLGKHLKLFTDVAEVSGKDGQPLKILIDYND